MRLASSQSKSISRERMALVAVAMCSGRTERPMRKGDFGREGDDGFGVGREC